MPNRLFLSLSDLQLERFEAGRNALGMSRSRYLQYLIEGQKEIRPMGIRYRVLVDRMAEIERDLKIIAMKEELSDQDRISLMVRMEELKNAVVEQPLDKLSRGFEMEEKEKQNADESKMEKCRENSKGK